MDLALHRLKYDGASIGAPAPAGSIAPTEAQVAKKIKSVLALKAKVDESDITLTRTSLAGPNHDPLQYTAVILASSHTTAATKVSAWEAMLLPAGREIQQFYKDSHANLAPNAQGSHYRVMVGIT